MEENGLVMEVSGGVARVRLVRRETCEKCGICGFGGKPEIVLEVPDTLGVRPGDTVRLAMESGGVLRAATAVYLLPLAALLGGYLVADWLAGLLGAGAGEVPGIVGGILFMIAVFTWIRRYDRRFSARYQPVMRAIVPGEDPPAGSC